MKTYHVTEQQQKETAAYQVVLPPDENAAPGEGSFGALAFQWNNALLLAARRLWETDAVASP